MKFKHSFMQLFFSVWIMVLLLLSTQTLKAQDPPPPPPAPEPPSCFTPCGEATFSNHSYTTNIDNASGCVVTIKYKTRYCPLTGTYDVELQSIAFANDSCSTLASEYIFNRVLYIFTQSTLLGFPPFLQDSLSVYRWRIARPACLRKASDTLVRCGNQCCITDLQVRVRCEGVRQFSETGSTLPTQCESTVEEDCIHVCNRRFWDVGGSGGTAEHP